MIARIKLLWKSHLACSDISTRSMTLDELLLPQSWRFCITSNLWVSGFSYCIFFIFESSQLRESLTDLQDSGLYNYIIILGIELSPHESVNVIVILIFNHTSNNFFETPCTLHHYVASALAKLFHALLRTMHTFEI